MQEFCLQHKELKLVMLISFQSCQPQSFTKMLLPQWVLVPTSSIWLLSLPVPHCFQQRALLCGLCKVLQPERGQLTVFLKSNRSETLKCICLHQFVCINLFAPGLLLQLWLSAKIISNQFSICSQCWYHQLICSLQRAAVPGIVSYRSQFSTCFLA